MSDAKTATSSNMKVKSNKRKKCSYAAVPATPITAEGERPQKKFYRQRAHCNPLAHNDTYDYPVDPSRMDWSQLYTTNSSRSSSEGVANKQPTVLDVGCGFGGLTVRLAALLPNERILGLEIRAKVTEYVRLRIVNAGLKNNAAVLRTNSMKHLPNYLRQSSVNKLFFCFPDPHFKRKNHPRRIVSVKLLHEYAYVLKVGGRLYCITDVKELHEWHVRHLEAHPLFRAVPTSNADNSTSDDPCVQAMNTATEESQKVDRNKGSKYYCVYERIANADAPAVDASNFF